MFEDSRDAKAAIEEMDGKRIFGGDALRVEYAGKGKRERDGSRERRSPRGNCYQCNRPGHM
jgi:RNA recognition motif-containing protein